MECPRSRSRGSNSPTVRILGPLELGPQAPPIRFSRRKIRLLFLMLLVHRNTVVSRDALAEWLWPAQPPTDPRASLRSYASTLHRVLDKGRGSSGLPSLVSSTGGYLLRIDDAMLDAALLGHLVEHAGELRNAERHVDALGAIQDALSLVRGAPLEDVIDMGFAASEVDRLEGLVLQRASSRSSCSSCSVGRAPPSEGPRRS